MALSDNPYRNLPLTTLQQMQAQCLQAQTDILTGGKSYSFPGRTVTMAELPQITDMLRLLATAISYVTGPGKQSAQVTVNTQSQFLA